MNLNGSQACLCHADNQYNMKNLFLDFPMNEKLRESLEFLFYFAVIGLMYIGPPPTQESEVDPGVIMLSAKYADPAK